MSVNGERPAWSVALSRARTTLRGGAGGMRLASDAFNVALLVAFVLATLEAWRKATYYYAQSGGMPNPSDYGCGLTVRAGCGALLQGLLPTLHLRLYWLALAWVAAIVAGGCAILAVGGARWAYWRVHDYLA